MLFSRCSYAVILNNSNKVHPQFPSLFAVKGPVCFVGIKNCRTAFFHTHASLLVHSVPLPNNLQMNIISGS